jgi:hypothetical protein
MSAGLLIALSWFVQPSQLLAESSLVLPLVTSSQGEPSSDSGTLAAILGQELTRQTGHAVVSWLEVPTALRQRALGCADAPCAVELGRQMRVADVVVGRLDRVGSQQVLMLHHVRVSDGKVLGSSVTRVVSTDAAAVLDAVPAAVGEMVGTTSPQPVERVTGMRVHSMEVDVEARASTKGTLGFEGDPGVHSALVEWGSVAYPVEGPGKTRLSWGEFYRRVGRVDLAEALEQRAQIRTWLTWISNAASAAVLLVLGVMGLVGLGILLFPAVNRNAQSQGVPTMFTQTGGPFWWAGMALLCVASLLGVLLFVGETSFPSPAMFMNAQPAGEVEIRAMADEYNRSL